LEGEEEGQVSPEGSRLWCVKIGHTREGGGKCYLLMNQSVGDRDVLRICYATIKTVLIYTGHRIKMHRVEKKREGENKIG